MLALVTGVAGFIGSHLAEALIEQGHHVRGVDSFSSYYDRATKQANLTNLVDQERFELVEADLCTTDLEPLVDGCDVVFHQAGQPGVRLSWADRFDDYVTLNVVATQRLLEVARHQPLQRFVLASSSSVYGNAVTYPTTEETLPKPHSPYGVTKLAAENLGVLYAANWDVPTVALRYFTVYGPRQRPDMAIHRMIESGLGRDSFRLFGTGRQVRDFTFVGDAVAANLAATRADVPAGEVLNVAGGGSISMSDLATMVSDLLGSEIPMEQAPPQPGDVERTGGSIERARKILGWEPHVQLRNGLEQQVAWHLAREDLPVA